jgi:glutamate-ammonia-ligase adenylyltransferase
VDAVDAMPPASADVLADIRRAMSLSEYLSQSINRHPEQLADIIGTGELVDGAQGVSRLDADALAIDHLDRDLRRWRRREMMRVIIRDLSRRADLTETTRDLSRLADDCVEAAYRVHYADLTSRLGMPVGRSGAVQHMAVLALGKLGGGELNLSSDIDLIFFFDEPSPSNAETSNQAFFLALARAVIRSLDEMQADGFVFRVDMRLRPYGDSGPLVPHLAALEIYYEQQGRDWERYAFIKARAIAGDVALGERFLASLRPFVYRRHLDYGAIDALRDMKAMIAREVAQGHLEDDLKLGPGGIRDAEFTVQALQLVWAGTETGLQQRNFLAALTALADAGRLPEVDAADLRASYCFLRNSEHAVQAERDQQTQRLPTTDAGKARLAEAMGFSDWPAYWEALQRAREKISRCFDAVVSSAPESDLPLVEGGLQWPVVWRDQPAALIERAGFRDAARVATLLGHLHRALERVAVQSIARERVHKLMPALLALVGAQPDPDAAMERVLPIVEVVLRRSTYVAYLLENPGAVSRMVRLAAVSPWVADQFRAFPILLYELLDERTEQIDLSPTWLAAELERRLHRAGNLEEQMDELRRFRHAQVLKVAVLELLDLMPIMQVSDALTDIAACVTEAAVQIAGDHLTVRHGRPVDEAGQPLNLGFGVVAYGKFGGVELGYSSDLDVVFIHNGSLRGETDGETPIGNGMFYARLGQRVVHILTSLTQFGRVYEVDLRLRPSGNKGPLVTSLAAFDRYLTNDAWTWEFQALVRARYVAGDPALAVLFADLRRRHLQREWSAPLLAEVVAMRERMRAHLSSGSSGGRPEPPQAGESTIDAAVELISSAIDLAGADLDNFDLKHGAGAIVDIEFMVQYLVLAHVGRFPSLAVWSDKMRLLDELGGLGLLPAADVARLQEAWLAYRRLAHFEALGGKVASRDHLLPLRDDVLRIWESVMTVDDPG